MPENFTRPLAQIKCAKKLFLKNMGSRSPPLVPEGYYYDSKLIKCRGLACAFYDAT
jgi:hypothetical protein